MRYFLFWINENSNHEEWVSRRLLFEIFNYRHDDKKITFEIKEEEPDFSRLVLNNKYDIQFEYPNGSIEQKDFILTAFDLSPPNITLFIREV